MPELRIEDTYGYQRDKAHRELAEKLAVMKAAIYADWRTRWAYRIVRLWYWRPWRRW